MLGYTASRADIVPGYAQARNCSPALSPNMKRAVRIQLRAAQTFLSRNKEENLFCAQAKLSALPQSRACPCARLASREKQLQGAQRPQRSGKCFQALQALLSCVQLRSDVRRACREIRRQNKSAFHQRTGCRNEAGQAQGKDLPSRRHRKSPCTRFQVQGPLVQ